MTYPPPFLPSLSVALPFRPLRPVPALTPRFLEQLVLGGRRWQPRLLLPDCPRASLSDGAPIPLCPDVPLRQDPDLPRLAADQCNA